MAERSLDDRYRDAQYRAMAAAYAVTHKNDAQKEPEPETEAQKIARYMGVPVRTPKKSH